MAHPVSKLSDQFSSSIQPAGARWHPDPMRAHGAWIYLFSSIGAGALVGADHGVEPAMMAGTAFAGAFLVVAAVDAGLRGKLRQVLLGSSIAVVASLLAIGWGAEPNFLILATVAALPALSAMVLAKTKGVLSPVTLTAGVAALTMAAPVAATAGGSSTFRAATLLILLCPFFCWRAMRVSTSLAKEVGWNRVSLRARGLREAAIAAIWTLAGAIGLRIV